MGAILLIAVVPALVIATALYAVLAEARHNRMRRTRWERRAQIREVDRRLERVAGGR